MGRDGGALPDDLDREIGILMAIGTSPRRLVSGIVTESVLLTLLGVITSYSIHYTKLYEWCSRRRGPRGAPRWPGRG